MDFCKWRKEGKLQEKWGKEISTQPRRKKTLGMDKQDFQLKQKIKMRKNKHAGLKRPSVEFMQWCHRMQLSQWERAKAPKHTGQRRDFWPVTLPRRSTTPEDPSFRENYKSHRLKRDTEMRRGLSWSHTLMYRRMNVKEWKHTWEHIKDSIQTDAQPIKH